MASKITNITPELIRVDSSNVKYTDGEIVATYAYNNAKVTVEGKNLKVTPVETKYTFKTCTKVGKIGMMLVGWGGNNGTTVTGGIIANRENIKWHDRKGEREPK